MYDNKIYLLQYNIININNEIPSNLITINFRFASETD